MWKLGWELPCGAPFHGPSVTWLLWASVPRTPFHPLDTPAEFTSLTRSLLPPQGRLLLGTFEPVLGMQFEAAWRVMEEKGRTGRGEGPPPARPRRPGLPGGAQAPGGGAKDSPCLSYTLTFQ